MGPKEREKALRLKLIELKDQKEIQLKRLVGIEHEIARIVQEQEETEKELAKTREEQYK